MGGLRLAAFCRSPLGEAAKPFPRVRLGGVCGARVSRARSRRLGSSFNSAADCRFQFRTKSLAVFRDGKYRAFFVSCSFNFFSLFGIGGCRKDLTVY